MDRTANASAVGLLMVLVSAFPLAETFVVWCPAAVIQSLQGE